MNPTLGHDQDRALERVPQRQDPRSVVVRPPPPSPVPVAVPDPPPRRVPASRFSRMLAHAAIVIIVAHVIEQVTAAKIPTGYAAVLTALRPGGFVPLGVACSAAMHAQRTVIVLLTGLIVVGIWPCTINDLAVWLVPVGAGIMLGAVVQRLVLENRGVSE